MLPQRSNWTNSESRSFFRINDRFLQQINGLKKKGRRLVRIVKITLENNFKKL